MGPLHSNFPPKKFCFLAFEANSALSHQIRAPTHFFQVFALCASVNYYILVHTYIVVLLLGYIDVVCGGRLRSLELFGPLLLSPKADDGLQRRKALVIPLTLSRVVLLFTVCCIFEIVVLSNM